MTRKILVVDDKAGVRKLVQEYLVEEGFQVVTADNGRDALYAARHQKPDLILLDIMMPQMSGFDFMRHYSQESDTPVIVLTAKMEESDKVLGLELGADDYVTKPFSMRELLARIRAVLRRVERGQRSPEVLRVSDLLMDKGFRLVQVGDREVTLTPSEFDILAALMSSPGRVFSRAELLEHLPGEAFDGAERSIDIHISNLRKKIEVQPDSPRYIQTVFGVGYRLCAEPAS